MHKLPTKILLSLGLAVTTLWSPPAQADEEVVRLLLEQNRLTEAMPICRQLKVLNGGAGPAAVDCAWVYYRSNRLGEGDAIRSKLKGKKFIKEVRLMTAYSYIKKKEFSSARETLNEMEKEFKGKKFGYRVQLLSAEMYEALGRIDTAAFIYKGVISERPRNGMAHWGLARHHLNRRENAKATRHLKSTARLWPKHLASRFNLGVLYLNQGNLSEAGKWLAECYQLDRGDAGVLEQLGVLFEKKGKFGDAIKYWQKAIKVNEKSEVARAKLKKYYGTLIDRAIASGEIQKAAVYLENAKRVGNKSKKNMLRRGVILRHKGQYEKAAGDLLAYLNQFPKDSLALRELGISYINMSLFDEANTYLTRAIRTNGRDGLNYAWYAWLLERNGKVCKARKAWKRAVQLLKDSRELSKATRKLASIERKARGICK